MSNRSPAVVPWLLGAVCVLLPGLAAVGAPPPDDQTLAAVVHCINNPGDEAAYQKIAACNIQPDDPMRARALVASLGRFGPRAVPFLLTQIANGPKVGPVAQQSLADIGQPSVVPVTEAIRKETDPVRVEALVGVVELLARRDLAWVLPPLKDADPRVRERVTSGIGRYVISYRGRLSTAQLSPLAEELRRLLRDPDAGVRRQTIRAFRGLDAANASQSAAQFAALLDDPDPDTQWQSAEALAATDAVSTVERTLAKGGTSGRRYAAYALACMGTKARPAVVGLIAALKDREALVRRNAADALGRIGALLRGNELQVRCGLQKGLIAFSPRHPAPSGSGRASGRSRNGR